MNESEVIRLLYDAVKSNKFTILSQNDLYLDYHPSLSSIFLGRDVQRFTLPLPGFNVHPDLVGRMADGDSLFAVEAKGLQEILKGIAQAEIYQYGFHTSFYALPSRAISPIIIDLAKKKNIGLISVDILCEIIHTPVVTNPQKIYADKIRRQFNAAVSVKQSNSFLYNLPTHYLFWLSTMSPNIIYNSVQMQDMRDLFIASNSKFHASAAGAERLGLIRKRGGDYSLTEMGTSAKLVADILLPEWRNLHIKIKRDSLIDISPRIAGVLRMLMIFDEKLSLLLNGIKRLSANSSVSYIEIAMECDAIDHDTSLIYFFKPEYLETILEGQYNINWKKVEDVHLRPTVDYQTKSMMYHAGFIRKSNLNSKIWNV